MALRARSADSGHVQAEDLDDIVQRLVVAQYALEAKDVPTAAQSIDHALRTARRLMSAAAGGDLRRTRPAD